MAASRSSDERCRAPWRGGGSWRRHSRQVFLKGTQEVPRRGGRK